MVFWKVKPDPYEEARTGRRSLPIFLTILLAGAIYYGFSELSYLLYTKIFDAVQSGITNYKIDSYAPFLNDFNIIVRSALFLLIGVLGVLYVRFLEGRKLSTMGYHKKGLAGGILGGLGIAVLLIGSMIAVFLFAGSILFEGELDLHFGTVLLDVLALLILGFSSELYFRGFLLSSLGARCKPLLAVLLTALVSTVGHSFYWGWNIYSFYNNLLFDLLLGLLAVRTCNAWLAGAVRSFWLILCQLVFGILYSGQACYYKLIPNVVNYENGGWVGASCVDTGNVFTAVMLIGILLVLLLPKKDPRDEEEEQKPFFQHVPVEKKAPDAAPAAAPEKKAAEPVLRRPESLKKTPVPAEEPVESPAEEDEENWDEEETRAIVHPEFKNPEQYLK